MMHNNAEITTRLKNGPALVIDTAGRSCQVGIFTNGRLIAERSPEMKHGQAEHLIPLVQEVMGECSLDYVDLQAVAVTAGPGSFTGLRVGLAAAQGFAVVAKCPVIAVSSLSAWAVGELPIAAGESLRVALDSRRGDAFVQDFDANGRAISEPAILPLEDAVGSKDNAQSGAIQYIGDLVSDLAAPTLSSIYAASCKEEHQLPPQPIYLRPPDAVPASGLMVGAVAGNAKCPTL